MLTLDPRQVDVWRFVQLLGEAAGASDQGEERVILSRALSLWRGEPFDGIKAVRLAESESGQLTERYLAAVERSVDLDVVDGRVDDLTDDLRRLTARYPLRESLWGRLITVLARSGRQAEALETYEPGPPCCCLPARARDVHRDDGAMLLPRRAGTAGGRSRVGPNGG